MSATTPPTTAQSRPTKLKKAGKPKKRRPQHDSYYRGADGAAARSAVCPARLFATAAPLSADFRQVSPPPRRGSDQPPACHILRRRELVEMRFHEPLQQSGDCAS